MKILLRKSRCWNSVVYGTDSKITISSTFNGKQLDSVYNSIDDVVENRKNLSIKDSKWVLVIPDKDCIFKKVVLPAANIDEASKMLEYELHGLVPVDPQELVSGSYEISHQAGSYNLCVCIIKKSLLDQYYEDLKQIGITPERVLVHSLSIKEICKAGDDCTVLLSNLNSALLIQYASGHTPVSRYFQVGSNSIPGFSQINNNGEDVLFALPEAIKNKHRQELADGSDITSSDFMGGCIRDCHPEDDTFLARLISKGAIRICRDNKYDKFNLIHGEELKNRARKKALTSYFLNGITIAVLLFLIWLNLWLGNIRLSKEIDVINLQIEPIKDVATQVGAKKIQLNAIKDQIQSKGKIIKILDEIYRYTPDNISLNELKIENSGKNVRVQIKGQTQDHASAFGYTQALKKASYIDGLNIGVGHMIPKPGGKSIVEFTAECVLSEQSNDEQ